MQRNTEIIRVILRETDQQSAAKKALKDSIWKLPKKNRK